MSCDVFLYLSKFANLDLFCLFWLIWLKVSNLFKELFVSLIFFSFLGTWALSYYLFPPALSRVLSAPVSSGLQEHHQVSTMTFLNFFFMQVLSTVNMPSLCLTDFGTLCLHFHSLKRIFKFSSSFPSPSSYAVTSCLDSLMLCTFCRFNCCYLQFSSFVEYRRIKHSILIFLYLLRFTLCPNMYSNLEKILGAS